MRILRGICRISDYLTHLAGLGAFHPQDAKVTDDLAAWRGLDRGGGAGLIHCPSILRAMMIDAGPHLGPIGSMSAIAKSRIDPELKRQAEGVLEEIGLKPRAALELFYKQIVKRRAIPFPVQADVPEDEVLSSAARRNALADEF